MEDFRLTASAGIDDRRVGQSWRFLSSASDAGLAFLPAMLGYLVSVWNFYAGCGKRANEHLRSLHCPHCLPGEPVVPRPLLPGD